MTTEPKSPLSYLGIAETNPPDVSIQTRDPATTDYKQWYVGDIWINNSSNKAFVMTGKTATAGTWRSMTVSDFSITGNAGGAVEPEPATANINLVGTATNGINIVGNPATFTLTIGLQSPYSDGNFRFANNLAVGIAPIGTADLEITRAAVGKVEVSLNNTAAGSAYYSAISQAGGADAYFLLQIAATTNYSFGIDNSDSDELKLTDGTSPSLGATWIAISPVNRRMNSNFQIVNQHYDIAGQIVYYEIENFNATNVGSHAMSTIVCDASGGDPFINFETYVFATSTAVNQYSFGIDNAANDSLKITYANALAAVLTPSTGTMFWEMTTAGERIMPLQPSFLAYNSADALNQTGNGAVAIVPFDTELYDIGAHFGANTFTAPIAGKYRFTASVQMSNLAAATLTQMILVTTGGSYILAEANPTACASSAGNFEVSGSVLVSMAATNTAHITLQNTGSVGDTNTIRGSASPYRTFFSGQLEV